MCLLHNTKFSSYGLVFYLISLGTILVQLATFVIPLVMYKDMEVEDFYPDEIEDLQSQYQVWR